MTDRSERRRKKKFQGSLDPVLKMGVADVCMDMVPGDGDGGGSRSTAWLYSLLNGSGM